MSLTSMILGASLFIAMAMILFSISQKLKEKERAEYIRSMVWPPGLLDRLVKKYPDFGRKETALIGQGLRQFFLAYLLGGRKYVAMPSQAADELWHEFILYTREYDAFCSSAFGQFLHHTPAVALSSENKTSNEGLRRVWWRCCKEENIDPQNPTRLPLLFALDKKLNIPNGYVYHPNCEQLRRNGVAGTQCGGDFSSSSVDGSTDGFGDSSSGGDGGSGDGGGCGGGD